MNYDLTFAKDVEEGLGGSVKSIPSKYFYDSKGDELFQKIMDMPEYYPTNSEFEIFELHKKRLGEFFSENCRSFDLIEFGAGDGQKTKLLLSWFLENKIRFKYFPIDISENVIKQLSSDLKDSFHCINFEGQVGDYFDKLNTLTDVKRCRKVILFLGSNLGNYNESEAVDFIRQIAKNMSSHDYLLIGLDIKKEPDIILEAYNDKNGITRDFNLNLLKRMNTELGADFDISKFLHYPVYNPLEGTAKSYIVSKEEQTVFFKSLNRSFHFRQWEAIFTEISQKYDLEDINRIAEKSGMEVVENFFDKKKYFVDTLWRIKH